MRISVEGQYGKNAEISGIDIELKATATVITTARTSSSFWELRSVAVFQTPFD